LWPPDLGIIDTLIGFPADPTEVYAGVRRGLRDRESLEDFEMPAGYMFRDLPAFEDKAVDARLESTLVEMDRFGIAMGLVSLSSNQDVTETAVTRHPDRFVGSWTVDPNTGMDGIRALVRAHERWGLRAVSFMPHGLVPQVAIDAPLAYICYAKCVELDLPVFITVGIARAPRAFPGAACRTTGSGSL
jgi:predicted TIM-barrel fold metal-dependent hydrolase